MNELKPTECTVCLPWGFSETSDSARKKHCSVCAGTGLVYAIPDTHRVVSVELLTTIEKAFVDYEMAVGDAPPYPHLKMMKELRAIIDNKGQS